MKIKLNNRARQKLLDILYEEEIKTLEGMDILQWESKSRRHIWDTPEHFTRIYEISKYGMLKEIDTRDYFNYEPPENAYVLLVEHENVFDSRKLWIYTK